MNAAPRCLVVRTTFGLSQGTGARYDLRPVGASRRQDAMVAYQVESWRRYEGSQFLQQFLRRQQELTRTIGPVSFQGEDQRLFIDEAQSAAGDGRSDHVAAEPLEPTSVGGLDAGGA